MSGSAAVAVRRAAAAMAERDWNPAAISERRISARGSGSGKRDSDFGFWIWEFGLEEEPARQLPEHSPDVGLAAAESSKAESAGATAPDPARPPAAGPPTAGPPEAESHAGMESTMAMIGKSMAYGYRSVKPFVWNVEGHDKGLWGQGLRAEHGPRFAPPPPPPGSAGSVAREGKEVASTTRLESREGRLVVGGASHEVSPASTCMPAFRTRRRIRRRWWRMAADGRSRRRRSGCVTAEMGARPPRRRRWAWVASARARRPRS